MNTLFALINSDALSSRGMLYAVILSALVLSSCTKNTIEIERHQQTASNNPDALITAVAASPTTGWTQTSYSYNIQTPWNLSQSSRYSYSGGEHRFWIYPGDACQYEGCSTGPRSELRMNNNYTSGKHQFEGDVYIVSGSAGTDIMQVFGGATHATAIMLKIHSGSGGTIKRYDNETLMTNAYNKWIHVNVQHDADNGRIYVYLDGTLKGSYADRGNATHYFKCGVYNISGSRSETRWKNVKYWRNGPVGQ
jgi:hypothetical protein